MRLSLDHSLMVARRVGEPDRLPRRLLQARVARMAPVQDELLEAAEQGLLPHAAPRVIEGAAKLADAWAEKHDRIVVFGEAGAVSGATLWHPGEGLHRVRSPDGAALRRALIGSAKPLLIVLDGPPWVRALARRMTGVPMLWVQGDGTDASTPPDGVEVLSAEHAADLRFAPFGLLAQALACHGGLELEGLAATWAEAWELCSGRGMHGNPALLLAALLDAMDEQDGGAPTLIAPTEGLLRLATWARGSVAAITVKPAVERTLRTPRGQRPDAGLLGDEGLVQRLAAGPGGTWALVIDWEGGEPRDRLLRKQLQDAQIRLLAQSRRPVLRLRVSETEPGALVALATLVVHAALALATLRGVPPLALPAADRLRELMQELDDPSPGENAGRE